MSVFNKQPFYTAYIKYFNTRGEGLPFITWIYSKISNLNVLTPFNSGVSVVIQNDLYVNGHIYGTVTPPSDQKLKENIKDLDEEATEKIMQLRPKQYNFKSDPRKKTKYGFIAQEVETIFPEWIETNDLSGEPVKSIHTLELIPLLLLKIQDLQNQVDELKKNGSNGYSK